MLADRKALLEQEIRKAQAEAANMYLSIAIGGLLLFGTLLVYAATRNWYSSSGLDPAYYLKRHVINIIIGLAMAYGATIIDYRLLRG